jgi:hypothetical protein
VSCVSALLPLNQTKLFEDDDYFVLLAVKALLMVWQLLQLEAYWSICH